MSMKDATLSLSAIFPTLSGFAALQRVARAYEDFGNHIKDTLNSEGFEGVTGEQAIMVWHMHHHKQSTGARLSSGDLTRLKYYTGANASYNIGKMERDGFITKTEGNGDKRRVYLELTPKGEQLAIVVHDSIMELEAFIGEAFKNNGIGAPALNQISRVAEDLSRGYYIGSSRPRRSPR